jgi:hypothetical protein
MSNKAWLGVAIGSLTGFPVGMLEDSNSTAAAILMAACMALGIFAVVKCFSARDQRASARPAPGPSYRDVALLRSLALGFVVAIGAGVLVLGPVIEGASPWLLLTSPGGGAASFLLTLWLQVRGRDELGDPGVPPAGVIRRRP